MQQVKLTHRCICSQPVWSTMKSHHSNSVVTAALLWKVLSEKCKVSTIARITTTVRVKHSCHIWVSNSLPACVLRNEQPMLCNYAKTYRLRVVLKFPLAVCIFWLKCYRFAHLPIGAKFKANANPSGAQLAYTTDTHASASKAQFTANWSNCDVTII